MSLRSKVSGCRRSSLVKISSESTFLFIIVFVGISVEGNAHVNFPFTAVLAGCLLDFGETFDFIPGDPNYTQRPICPEQAPSDQAPDTFFRII